MLKWLCVGTLLCLEVDQSLPAIDFSLAVIFRAGVNCSTAPFARTQPPFGEWTQSCSMAPGTALYLKLMKR